ncbi:MAG TPA: tyrosine-type recombinase/integrase [Thermoanaerobaculaceae bacterium]|nr:tyrosine-type recombinase/integrase [Thermoanaerobaculaceae bacterium]
MRGNSTIKTIKDALERGDTVRLPFTKEALEQLAPGLKTNPKGEPIRYDVYDAGPKSVRGLCVTVTPNGAMSYYLVRKVGARSERMRIEAVANLAPEQARKRATALNAEIGEGRNPAEARRGRRAEPTLAEVWELYEAHHKQPSTGRKSIASDAWRYNRHLATWGRRKLLNITRGEVARLHATITKDSGAVAANRAVALLSSIFGWWSRTVGRDIPNPCRGVRRNDETPRERYLLPDEMRRWWAATLAEHDQDTAELAALLLLLGVRRGNLQAARWEQIDLPSRAWRIPAGEMKSNREHLAPLPVPAAAILAARHARRGEPESGWVFPGPHGDAPLTDPRNGLAHIATAAKVYDFHPHDLRRSCATWALEAGVDSAVVGYLLAHTDPSVTGIYRKVTFATALDATDRAAIKMLQAAGLKPNDFARGLPAPPVIRPVTDEAQVIQFEAGERA